MKNVNAIIIICLFALSACATQRYGRETSVTSAERELLDCKQLNLEISKTEGFLSDVRMQRADTNGMHALGFLGDFGIGNVLEGDAAELSGEKRLKELRELKSIKHCA